MSIKDSKIPVSPPPFRRLRVLAFDPSLAIQLDTAEMNQLTLEIPWETPLDPGPIGEYVEVIDYDPGSGFFYEPVDLEDPNIIARDGLTPSESNPQFHQQMVYAVAMSTIRQFERALGRVAFWADRTVRLEDGSYINKFVRRLRIYPHALRQQNAYYSPPKKSLMFGYFPVTAKDAYNSPGTLVFTCLSHDIIAHEVTHALLDGVHPRFNDSTNPDVHAFHEAFADIVALFQHFSYPQVLESQIKNTRGNLETESLLGQLAQEFGRATGRGSALRDALGSINPESGEWEFKKADPHAYETIMQPHARGSILVAAVFRAFLLVYSKNTEDLFRIVTHGTGTLPEGDIHPDLTKRLSIEAAEAADRILQMCIRAIDYCPPVGVTFGDFLRGVITADIDFAPQDDTYRIVFIQSFREWGIKPRQVTSMGMDALKWPSAEELMRNKVSEHYKDQDYTEYVYKSTAARRRRQKLVDNIKDSNFLDSISAWDLGSDRYDVWKNLRKLRSQIHEWFEQDKQRKISMEDSELFGLVLGYDKVPKTVKMKKGTPTVEVHSARPTVRKTFAGSYATDIVIEITQKRMGFFDEKVQVKMDEEGPSEGTVPDFIYRAGCTIIIDTTTKDIRRVICTPGNITNNEELDRLRKFIQGEYGVIGNSFDAGYAEHLSHMNNNFRDEPFALLHQQ
ncbi:hypothetical protein POV27_09570 [Aureisphaera galaxeae]|uniref:hypothetical protein n=1 Tax=Aureisphaera galaxeae TaxID=1538023 RepID=UPI002350CAAD|nr:hypothetical protein [Aureisphaera galaxeae]MDC8004299.1 hypothetical protein [Aureisphaera galaxeae]